MICATPGNRKVLPGNVLCCRCPPFLISDESGNHVPDNDISLPSWKKDCWSFGREYRKTALLSPCFAASIFTWPEGYPDPEAISKAFRASDEKANETIKLMPLLVYADVRVDYCEISCSRRMPILIRWWIPAGLTSGTGHLRCQWLCLHTLQAGHSAGGSSIRWLSHKYTL